MSTPESRALQNFKPTKMQIEWLEQIRMGKIIFWGQRSGRSTFMLWLKRIELCDLLKAREALKKIKEELEK